MQLQLEQLYETKFKQTSRHLRFCVAEFCVKKLIHKKLQFR